VDPESQEPTPDRKTAFDLNVQALNAREMGEKWR